MRLLRLFIILFCLFATTACNIDSVALSNLYPFELVNKVSPSTDALVVLGKDTGPVIFYLHGNGENLASLDKTGLPTKLNKYGPVVLSEYTGLGPRTGLPNQKSIMDTIVSDYKSTKLVYPDRKMIVVGWSLGAAVAAQLAKLKPDGLILISSWNSTKEASKASKFGFLSRFISDEFWAANEWDTLLAIKGYEGKAMVIHGKSDNMIPFDQGKNNAVLLGVKIVEVDAGHNDIFTKPDTWAAIEEFFK